MNNNYGGFVNPNQSTEPPYQNFNYNQGNMTNPNEAPYAENILELNIGKTANFYMSYSDSLEWRDRVFSGVIVAAGRDYAVIRDSNTNHNFLLWTVYLNYVEFLENIILKR